METNSKKIGEISIPVPWGNVAAKTWGEEQDPLILCVHGILDNAGSFDRIIPLLPSSYYYVCIDLPGHGKSTHFPPHMTIHTINYILIYREATKNFKSKFIIMGHSYGGQLGFLYAQMYPEYVEKLIMLDTVAMYPVDPDQFAYFIGENVDIHFKIIKTILTKQTPLYTRSQALNKIQNFRSYSKIGLESAEALLQRAIEPVGEFYKFTLDQRLKNFINPLRDHRIFIETVKVNPVKCPVLVILSKENEFHLELNKPIVDFFKKLHNIQIVEVDGHHDVHNDYPDRVSPYINKFLTFQKGKY